MARPASLDDMTIYDAAHVENTCRPGHGALTCAYLMRGPQGWSCAKRDGHFARLIALRIFEGTLRAQGDNCFGWMSDAERNAHAALMDEARCEAEKAGAE